MQPATVCSFFPYFSAAATQTMSIQMESGKSCFLFQEEGSPKVILSVLMEAAYCHHQMILYQHLYTLCRTQAYVPLLSIYAYVSASDVSAASHTVPSVNREESF